MDCREFQTVLFTSRSGDRAKADEAALVAHAATCAPCAQLREEMARLGAAVARMAGTTAPEGFTQAVMMRLEQAPERAGGGLWEWLFGASPVPGRAAQKLAAVAALALLLVSGGTYLGRTWHSGDGPAAAAYATTHAGPRTAGAIDQAKLDELISRHQAASKLQPLSDDEGMQLVSYSLGDAE